MHHTAYITGRKAWDYPGELLMCICSECHPIRQSREDAFRVAIGRITRFMKPEHLEEEVWRILDEAAARETQRLAEAFS